MKEIPIGQRNQKLTKLAGEFCKVITPSEDRIYGFLQVANQMFCETPLEDSEIKAIAASVARYENAPLSLS